MLQYNEIHKMRGGKNFSKTYKPSRCCTVSKKVITHNMVLGLIPVLSSQLRQEHSQRSQAFGSCTFFMLRLCDLQKNRSSKCSDRYSTIFDIPGSLLLHTSAHTWALNYWLSLLTMLCGCNFMVVNTSLFIYLVYLCVPLFFLEHRTQRGL